MLYYNNPTEESERSRRMTSTSISTRELYAHAYIKVEEAKNTAGVAEVNAVLALKRMAAAEAGYNHDSGEKEGARQNFRIRYSDYVAALQAKCEAEREREAAWKRYIAT